MKFLRSSLMVALLCVTASAQILSLQTTLQGGNGQKGAMFNVVNISAGNLLITSLEQRFFSAGTATMAIYTKTGSYVGSELLAAAGNWTLLGTVAGVVHTATATTTLIPIVVNTVIAAGATRAFYVTATTATASNIAYTNGNLIVPPALAGQVHVADANLQMISGVGKSYPFGSTFGGPTPGGTGRCWNGKINYVLGTVPPAPNYQVNQAGAYMDFDFVLASAGAPAVLNKCGGGIVNACADSFGNPADIYMNAVPLVSSNAGGTVLNNANVVNLDIAAGFFPLFGGFGPLGLASGTCPIFFAAPIGTISAQMIVIDLTVPGFISLSQACQLNGIAQAPVTLPNADDGLYILNLSAPPFCRGPLSYYGTSYTQLVVSTNGLMFPGAAGNAGYIPSFANAIIYPGLFGVWADWQSNMGTGTIVANGAGAFNGVDVAFTNIPYFGTTITSSFTIGLDALGPRLEGLSGLGVHTADVMLAVSRGGGLATNAGPTAFSLGATGTTAANTDMLYAIGAGAPTLAGGANDLWFTFNGTGGVDWAGL
ncbi:MAG: hypothetical protein EXS14_02420 [Planctomycetes bacterium]|nr:hypothetical protein [Planctomycetota bacterium]